MLGTFEILPNSGWPLPAIHHGSDPNGLPFDGIVDREGESLGKRPVEAPIYFPMDATEQPEALDVGIQVDQEIIAKSLLFVLIKMEALDQVVPGQVENLEPH